MYHVACSIMTLQYLYGVIPNIHCKGECAKVWALTILSVHTGPTVDVHTGPTVE